MTESRYLVLHLDEVVDEARAHHGDWLEFLRRGIFSAGIYRLAAGQQDPQPPHNEDEIYFVLSGRAELEVEGTRHPAGPGTIAFVTRYAEHRFVNIEEDLEVLVIFAPPETPPVAPGAGA